MRVTGRYMLLLYSLNIALSNKYLEVIIKFLEPKILKKKVDVLFDIFILKKNFLIKYRRF